MAPQPSKIVVIGSVNGQFREVFGKASALHAKNAFSFAIIAGDLFADPSNPTSENEEDLIALIEGKTKVPLPTYFSVGGHPLPEKVVQQLEYSDDGAVCENLFFLGKRNTIKTSEGVKIVSLGGVLDPNIIGISQDRFHPFYNEGDAKSLRGANSADLLITSQWPANIRAGSKVNYESHGVDPVEQSCVADLCATLKPKYHFSTTSNIFFEREPFFHAPTESSPDAYPVTRFISLASFKNPQKSKWIYAFTLDPKAAPPVSVPTGTTASPLHFISNLKKRSADDSTQAFSRFAIDSNYSHTHSDRYRPSKRRRDNHQAPPKPQDCYFCLSSPTLATHLITSIGDDAYLTTSKGPLTTKDTFPSLAFPAHMLITPLTHAPTLAEIPEPEARVATYKELKTYQSALNKMVAKLGKGSLGSVTFEVARRAGVHVLWQWLPVDVSMVEKGLVEAGFKVEAENQKFPPFKGGDLGIGEEEGAPDSYFRVLIWRPENSSRDGNGDGDAEMKGNSEGNGEGAFGKEVAMHMPFDDSIRFDLQFGRRVMAKLLGLEDRAHWLDCGQSYEEEVADAEAFKEAFKPFDPA
ncbi:MAG: hypothetical protein M1820_007938 [Bogoriella megaspora]|nr:MAG: hypothetical protein M1820_007938 [Bogoriella megaspora]